MFGALVIYLINYLMLTQFSVHSIPSNILTFVDPNNPRQFVQTVGAVTRPIVTTYSSATTEFISGEVTVETTGEEVISGVTPEEDDNPNNHIGDDSSEDTSSESPPHTNLPGFPISPPLFGGGGGGIITVGLKPIVGAARPPPADGNSGNDLNAFGGFPSEPPVGGVDPLPPGAVLRPVAADILSTYPKQPTDGAVGPFPEKVTQQGQVGGAALAGGVSAAVALLQRLNPLNLFKPVTDTFQHIGHVLSHPNYGPGAALLRPVQFWSAVNAAGNPSLAPYRKLPANVESSSPVKTS